MSIIFDQLRISDDGSKMYIDAHVSAASNFSETTIEQLYICLGSQIYETLTIDPESNGYIFKKEYSNGEKEIHEVISIEDEQLLYNKTSFKELYFVYVKATGLPLDSACYTSVGNYFLGVVFNEIPLYRQVMQFTKELANDCQIPVGFTDYILLWNAFKASVETEHYIPAIKYWNMLFGKDADGKPYGASDKYSGMIHKPCGCHG